MLPARRGFFGDSLDIFLKEEIHQHVKRFRLDDDGSDPFGVGPVEVLMDAAVVHNDAIARFPLISLAVVDLVPTTFEDIEHRFVHMTMILGSSPRRHVL